MNGAGFQNRVRRWCRSEEHMSELQSPDHLVCLLLLENKKWGTTFLKSSWTTGGARDVDPLLKQPLDILNCFHLNATQFHCIAETRRSKLTDSDRPELV